MQNGELLKLYINDLKSSVYYDGKVRPKYYKWSIFNQLGLFFEKKNIPREIDVNNTWVWSDQHFYHKNIIEYSGRPFSGLDEMHDELLRRYNEVVKPDDVAIWVGDVGFAADIVINQMLSKYNGYKILIMGNHDMNHNKVRYLEFDEIYICYQVTLPEVNLCFTHYPMGNLPEPNINVHGHEHQHPGKVGRKPTTSTQHINVCCEYWDYTPVKLEDIIEIAMEKAKLV